MPSIFSRIFPHRQSEGKTPREDFFTETFAAVLDNSELFSNEFAKWLFELENCEEVSIDIKTQKNIDGRRPDIYVKVLNKINENYYVAIIESKIDSSEGKHQLKAYKEILSNNWPNAELKILVYITKYNEDIGEGVNPEFRQHRWSDLYKRFAKVKQECPEEVGALECELLKLMEDWNMDGSINAAHLRSFITCFDNGVGERLTNLQNDAWYASGLGNVLEKTEGTIWTHQYSWKG